VKVPDNVAKWLLSGEPWVAYQTRINLFHENLAVDVEAEYKRNIISSGKIQGLVHELQYYFPKTATRHTDSKLSHYKLRMLSDFGIAEKDGMSKIIEEVGSHTNNNLYSIRQQMPLRDADPSVEWNALPCDNPVILYALIKMGAHNSNIDNQVSLLKEKWTTPQGWFCHLPFVEGQFKKEHIGCPMAGLVALEVFSQYKELKDSSYAQNAYQTIRRHYDSGKSIYYFGRGKNFHTFKYPYVWYNALYMADVLTRFDFAKREPLVVDLIDWIEANADTDGTYTPTSIFVEYKDWDFGNKKAPSPWITYVCYKILDQFYN